MAKITKKISGCIHFFPAYTVVLKKVFGVPDY